MVRTRKESPLWLRAITDPEAKAWIKKHADEFPTESFLPHPIAYADKRVLAREKIASLVADGMPYNDPRMQTLAELVLQFPPRLVAKKLRLTRRDVYLRIRALKRLAISKWKAKREAAVLARGSDAFVVREPEQKALRTLKFSLHGEEQYAYEVQVGMHRMWVDSTRKRFTPEVQEVLNDLDDYKAQFQTLETETRGEG